MTKLLFEETIAYRKLPANYNFADKENFESEFRKEIRATYLLNFNNAIITTEGVVFMNYKLCKESLLTQTYSKEFNLRYLLSTLLRKKKISLPDDIIYLLVFNYWYKGYFHWITETLPRLYIIKEQLKDITLILPEDLQRFHINSLAPFTFKDIMLIPDKHYAKVKNVIMPTHTAGTGNYNEVLIRHTRDYYQEYFKNNTLKNEGEKIFISREKATRRKIENEKDVRILLEKNGFKVINFEDYSFEEQVGIAFNAKIIIGLHGAGLTNMMFMQTGTSVLEFRFEGDTHNLCYYSLASALGLNYFYQFCKYAEPNGNSHLGNIIVDLKTLEKNLELM